jgi:hypothetical protein
MQTAMGFGLSTLRRTKVLPNEERDNANAMRSPKPASKIANALEFGLSTFLNAMASPHSASESMNALERGLSALQIARAPPICFHHKEHMHLTHSRSTLPDAITSPA